MSGSDVSDVCVNTRCACAAYAINMLHLENAVKSVKSERPDLKADAHFKNRLRLGFHQVRGVAKNMHLPNLTAFETSPIRLFTVSKY